jgi:hypothetical protein
MGGQKYAPPIDRETEAELQKAKEAENARWRTSQMLQSVMPSGSNRIIDWRSMPSFRR